MAHDELELTRLSSALGAEVHGLDLRQPVDDALFERLHRALLEHHVLFLRGQHLEDPHHLALGQRFGTPTVYPVLKLLGGQVPREPGFHRV